MIGPLDLSKYIADDWIDIVRKRNQDIINDEEYSHDDNREFVDEVGDQESDATKENEKLEEKIVEKITEKIEKSQSDSVNEQLDETDVASDDSKTQTAEDKNDSEDKNDEHKIIINEKLVQNTTSPDTNGFSPYGIWVGFYDILYSKQILVLKIN